MIYTIPKSEFKKGTTQKKIVYCMRDPETRMKWDKKFKEFYTMENGQICKIVYSRMNRPIFFISERDTIEKRYEFYINGNYYSYTSSVDDDSCEKFHVIPDVERLMSCFSTYNIEEDDVNFYFKTLNQLDYKMNTPNQLLGVTLPTNLKDWYKKLREMINSYEDFKEWIIKVYLIFLIVFFSDFCPIKWSKFKLNEILEFIHKETTVNKKYI